MNRRGFLGSILALGAAPAIVRAESIMRLATPELLAVPGYEIIKVLDCDFSSETFTQIVARVFRENQAQIKANALHRNALLLQMQRNKIIR